MATSKHPTWGALPRALEDLGDIEPHTVVRIMCKRCGALAGRAGRVAGDRETWYVEVGRPTGRSAGVPERLMTVLEVDAAGSRSLSPFGPDSPRTVCPKCDRWLDIRFDDLVDSNGRRLHLRGR